MSCSGGQCVPSGDFSDFSDFSGNVMGGGISCINGQCQSSGFSFSCTDGECNNAFDAENSIRDQFEEKLRTNIPYSHPILDPVATFEQPSFISPLAPDQIEAEEGISGSDMQVERTENGEGLRIFDSYQSPKDPPPKDLAWVPSVENDRTVPIRRPVVRIITNTGSGTGWVVKKDKENTAWIVTNRHVVSNPDNPQRTIDEIEVEFFSNPPPDTEHWRQPAQLVNVTANDRQLDLAILKVVDIPNDIEPLPICSDSPYIDMDVKVIGHPANGSLWSVTSGKISNIIRNTHQLELSGITLASGNSGSPVLSEKDCVVGLVVEVSKSNQQGIAATAGFGYAYKIDWVKRKLQEWRIIEQEGRRQREAVSIP
ncbi:S1 family peptidase [Coleofasciculus sp.]|uniref:S1 family peptidase n=1 Tax=Coleofasciculus sp. TaxID=3100458 RepID=UPI004062C303